MHLEAQVNPFRTARPVDPHPSFQLSISGFFNQGTCALISPFGTIIREMARASQYNFVSCPPGWHTVSLGAWINRVVSANTCRNQAPRHSRYGLELWVLRRGSVDPASSPMRGALVKFRSLVFYAWRRNRRRGRPPNRSGSRDFHPAFHAKACAGFSTSSACTSSREIPPSSINGTKRHRI